MSGGVPGPAPGGLAGGAAVLAADALQLPSTILLAAFLSRQLGSEGLGLYLLAAAVVTWIELVVSALFSRAAVHLVAESETWQPVASLVLRWHVGISVGFLLALWLAVAPFDHLFAVAGMRETLLLFSLEIPLFSLARCHTHVLVGLGRFRERAFCSGVRWTSRLVLSVGLVALGLSVRGAVLGAIGSTALELLVARRYVKPRWDIPAPPELSHRLRSYSMPLFAHGLALQLFHRLGLLVLVPLGGSVASAGIYGAADSLMRLRRILGQSLTPLLLSGLSRSLRDGAEREAHALARTALRCVFVTVVPVAAIAGAATPLMAWFFGTEFRAGGALLELLIWSAPGFLIISITAAILVASGKPAGTVWLIAPMLPLALVGFALVVPTYGALGVAAVTSATALAAAVACLTAVRSLWRVAPPAGTMLRAAVVGAAVYAVARLLPRGGWWLVLELPLLVAGGLGLFLLLGEASATELREVRRWLVRFPRAGFFRRQPGAAAVVAARTPGTARAAEPEAVESSGDMAEVRAVELEDPG